MIAIKHDDLILNVDAIKIDNVQVIVRSLTGTKIFHMKDNENALAVYQKIRDEVMAGTSFIELKPSAADKITPAEYSDLF